MKSLSVGGGGSQLETFDVYSFPRAIKAIYKQMGSLMWPFKRASSIHIGLHWRSPSVMSSSSHTPYRINPLTIANSNGAQIAFVSNQISAASIRGAKKEKEKKKNKALDKKTNGRNIREISNWENRQRWRWMRNAFPRAIVPILLLHLLHLTVYAYAWKLTMVSAHSAKCNCRSLDNLKINVVRLIIIKVFVYTFE